MKNSSDYSSKISEKGIVFGILALSFTSCNTLEIVHFNAKMTCPSLKIRTLSFKSKLDKENDIWESNHVLDTLV